MRRIRVHAQLRPDGLEFRIRRHFHDGYQTWFIPIKAAAVSAAWACVTSSAGASRNGSTSGADRICLY
jgi:hypothetical protein